MIPKKSESKYVSALPKIPNGPSLLTWQSAMSSIIFGPFRLLGNAHLFNWLFRWLVGIDTWWRSCRPEVRIQRRVLEENQRILKLLKTFEVWTLSNSNANFVTSLTTSTITLSTTQWIAIDVATSPFHLSSVAEHWTIFAYTLYVVSMYFVSLIQLLLPNQINHYHWPYLDRSWPESLTSFYPELQNNQ